MIFLTFNGKSGYIYLQLLFFPLIGEQTVSIAKSTMKSIYKYIDYRKYLKDFYDESKAAKPYFSYRFFAQMAGLKAPILLKLVIDGKRNLSRKAIDKFITGMNLKEKEAVYFRNLALFNQATSAIEKQEHYRFSEVNSDGSDLRFARADHSFLAYEIERWDTIARQADVWVNVDTVFGNNDSQYIDMYWGNQGAESISDGAAVFDTRNGFQGVWHLGELYGRVSDATSNSYNGSIHGNQVVTAGKIGHGQSYRDSGDYSDMGNVLNTDTASFTVSAWVKRSDTSKIQTIIAKSNGGTQWGQAGTFAFSSSSTIKDMDNWHCITVVIDRSGNGNCRLYVDGTDLAGNRIGDVTGVGALANTVNLRIGQNCVI